MKLGGNSRQAGLRKLPRLIIMSVSHLARGSALQPPEHSLSQSQSTSSTETTSEARETSMDVFTS